MWSRNSVDASSAAAESRASVACIVTCDAAVQFSPPGQRAPGSLSPTGRYSVSPRMRHGEEFELKTAYVPTGHAKATKASPEADKEVVHTGARRAEKALRSATKCKRSAVEEAAMRCRSGDKAELRRRVQATILRQTEHLQCTTQDLSTSAIQAQLTRRLQAADQHIQRQLAARKRVDEAKAAEQKRATVVGNFSLTRQRSASSSHPISSRSTSSGTGANSTVAAPPPVTDAGAAAARATKTAAVAKPATSRLLSPQPNQTTSQTSRLEAPTDGTAGDHLPGKSPMERLKPQPVMRRLDFQHVTGNGVRTGTSPDRAPSHSPNASKDDSRVTAASQKDPLAADGQWPRRSRSAASVRREDVDELRRELHTEQASQSARSSPQRPDSGTAGVFSPRGRMLGAHAHHWVHHSSAMSFAPSLLSPATADDSMLYKAAAASPLPPVPLADEADRGAPRIDRGTAVGAAESKSVGVGAGTGPSGGGLRWEPLPRVNLTSPQAANFLARASRSIALAAADRRAFDLSLSPSKSRGVSPLAAAKPTVPKHAYGRSSSPSTSPSTSPSVSGTSTTASSAQNIASAFLRRACLEDGQRHYDRGWAASTEHDARGGNFGASSSGLRAFSVGTTISNATDTSTVVDLVI
jgi:hypothetical protein